MITLVGKHIGLEGFICTALSHSDQAEAALETSSGRISSLTPGICATLTMVRSKSFKVWNWNYIKCFPIFYVAKSHISFKYLSSSSTRGRAQSTPEQTGWVYSLVVWSGHCVASGEHCSTGAQLLHSHGRPEWRQVFTQQQLCLMFFYLFLIVVLFLIIIKQYNYDVMYKILFHRICDGVQFGAGIRFL